MSSMNLVSDSQKGKILSAVGDADFAAKMNHSVLSYIDVGLTAAQVDALNATPVELIAAPGAGKVILVDKIYVFLDYNSTAWAGSSETIVLKYTDANGATIGTVTEAFIELTADAYQIVQPVTVVGVANAAVVATASADITTGNSPIYFRIYYRVVGGDISAGNI